MVRTAVKTLRQLAAVEMERAKFEKRFLEILDIWNLPKKEEKNNSFSINCMIFFVCT